MGSRKPDSGFGNAASPGKIFIGGLARDVTLDQFQKYFAKYGGLTDAVIMKEKDTGKPRGFGFVTYTDPSVVDTVIAETHVINGKQVEIKKTIPKGASESDFKTKKIFVGGISTSVTEDELKSFFSKYGKVVEQEIILDRVTNRSRGFGFVTFDNEHIVDNLLVNGNMIDMGGSQIEVKKAEPKKISNPGFPAAAAHSSGPRARGSGGKFRDFSNSHSDYGRVGFAPGPYSAPPGPFGGRSGDYGGYGGGGFEGRYGSLGGSDYMGYRGEGSLGYASRYDSYGGGGYGSEYGGSGLDSYGCGGGGYGGYGPGAGGYDSALSAGYGRGDGGYGGHGPAGGGYDLAPDVGYGGPGGIYGGRGGLSGGSRFHPYAR